jgi:ATP-dependent helicase HrpB
VCYRLWSAGEQAALVASTPPEILQADLAPLALELACWGANDPHSLRWLSPPPAAPLAQARDLLRELDALDEQGRLTTHGRGLARLGVHPRLAHMLVRSQDLGALALACDLAAILSERDLLRASPGARDADIRLRLDVMRGGARQVPPGMSVDARALNHARQTSARWNRALGGDPDHDIDADAYAGVVLAMAYPDRVGRSRGDTGRYVLANGRGALLADVQALGRAEYLVAAEVDGAERDARIRLAAPLPVDLLLEHFSQHIHARQSIAWDPQERAVKAVSERRLGALVLEAKPILLPAGQAVMRAVLEGIRSEGLDALPWTPQLRQWRARVQLMRAQNPTRKLPEWPDLSEAALLGQMEHWLAPWLDGITRRAHFGRIDLMHALQDLLTHAQKVALDQDAPTHFTVPSGSHIPIDYEDGDTPTLSVRLQEVFGLTRTPAVASGQVPLLLKLLSPAGRPVQVTRDLTSFWERGYHEVRKDLKGRYPKHYWPDDPHTAVPTRRVRPR